MRIISIFNQKGGVGKTTTAINLAASLATLNKKVLLIDFDAQGNSSRGFGIDITLIEKTIYDGLVNNKIMDSLIIPTQVIKNVDIIPSNLKLSTLDTYLSSHNIQPFSVLEKAISHITKKYDYVLIDCPPSLGTLSLNALNASDATLIPVQCEYFAMEGLAQVLSTINKVQLNYNKSLEIEGFLLTMYENRARLAREVVDQVKGLFRELTFNVKIPRNISISEASARGVPVIKYKPTSIGSQSYLQLAREILENDRRKEATNN